MKKIIKWPRYCLEIIGITFIHIVLNIIPFKQGSNLGGFLGRSIGRWAKKVNKVALKNLKQAFPDAEKKFYDQTIVSMWDNIGRTFLEYYKLPTLDPIKDHQHFLILGLEHFNQMHINNKGGFILTIHQANWELGSYSALKMGLPLSQVTRFVSNPLMRIYINYIHNQVAHEIIPKSAAGAKRIIKLVQNRQYVSMMMDQKLNEGIAVPFFNHPAMTATAIVKLAQKYQVPILPVQVIRYDDIKFKIIYHPLISLNENDQDLQSILYQINCMIEQWIIENPGQWFWVHKRYNKSFYL